PVAQKATIFRLRPSIQPRSRKPVRKESKYGDGVPAWPSPSQATYRIGPEPCPRAVSGQVAATLPNRAMNSRQRMVPPSEQRFQKSQTIRLRPVPKTGRNERSLAKVPCPLWVKSRHVRCKESCPLYPQKRTCALQLGMSALKDERFLIKIKNRSH